MSVVSGSVTSCAAFRVERQGDGVILRVIGLRPRDRAKRRAQLRKLCIRFLPDNAAVLQIPSAAFQR